MSLAATHALRTRSEQDHAAATDALDEIGRSMEFASDTLALAREILDVPGLVIAGTLTVAEGKAAVEAAFAHHGIGGADRAALQAQVAALEEQLRAAQAQVADAPVVLDAEPASAAEQAPPPVEEQPAAPAIDAAPAPPVEQAPVAP